MDHILFDQDGVSEGRNCGALEYMRGYEPPACEDRLRALSVRKQVTSPQRMRARKLLRFGVGVDDQDGVFEGRSCGALEGLRPYPFRNERCTFAVQRSFGFC